MSLEHLELSGTNIRQLASLQELFLSQNHLNETIPESVGWLSQLVSLDLEHNNLEGAMSEAHFGNLTELKDLYLSSNSLAVKVKSNWLPPFRLESLRMDSCKQGPEFPAWLQSQINISEIDISNASIIDAMPNWFWGLISTTEYVIISGNQISGHVPNLLHLNNLYWLDLSSNYFEGGIPTSFKNLCKLQNLMLSGINISKDLLEFDEIFSGCVKMSLENLGLSGTNISGLLPEWLFQLRKLKSLQLEQNLISGPIPVSIGQLASLQELFLSQNHLNETIPESVGLLSQLVSLGLGHNNLEGAMSEAHFGNLTELKDLYLSSNSLAVKVKSNWLPPFRLESLSMDSCKQGPEFPAWLQSQINISEIDISNASIVDAMPNWFWSLISTAEFVSISGNQISGHMPNLLHLHNLYELDLSSNDFEGPLPYFPPGLELLDLSPDSRLICLRPSPPDPSMTSPSSLM
ncbi:LRR receptor-like serine threonine-protein kinase [Musa troglodytarum]|uniref:LRR receptor-like serine threonine-protein kinase n=1 Tax=Musa troglodytarum TaxID=320322 RepID=A0A9E7FJM8_9LILI|nr:LRR receptor-like serine threonine-protein kinase [Musa troglodytarum]